MKKEYSLYKILAAAVLSVTIVYGCKKIPVGFLSGEVFYPDNPVKIDKGGSFQVTSALNMDGSTLPVTMTLLDIRNEASGKHADEFYEPHEVYVFKEAITQSDSTIELINAKRELKKIPMFQFLPNSGQFVFNSGTNYLSTGSSYVFDIKISNESGGKTYNNISKLTVIETPPYSILRRSCNYFNDRTAVAGNIQDCDITITQISTTGNQAILKIVDENGVPFNPRSGEIIKRGDRPTFESYAKFHPVEYTDTTLICSFEVAPFPLFQIPGYGSYDIFYRIPSKYAKITNPTAPYPGTDLSTDTYNINPAIGFLLKKEGTYTITVRLPRVRHV